MVKKVHPSCLVQASLQAPKSVVATERRSPPRKERPLYTQPEKKGMWGHLIVALSYTVQ